MTDDEGRVIGSEVSLRDRADVDALLNRLPPDVNGQLSMAIDRAKAQACHRMCWHGPTRRAFYFNSDGQTLLCVTLPEMTEYQARLCESEIDVRACYGNFKGIVAAYEAVAGRHAKLIPH